MENMNFCVQNKIKGALVSIDMSKAFDSVSHSYLEKVLDFFGFGVNFCKWIKTIGTKRKACIILGEGKKSKIFNLERGTAQGDSPSPFLYNMAAQILIWKIELDNEIEGIMPPRAGDINLTAAQKQQLFIHESNKETNKNESFADDANNFLKLKYETLKALKSALMHFKTLSGLECNVDKSFIMRIGDLSGDIEQRILDLGFPFTDELTVLGFILQNKGNMIAKNYEKISSKVSNIIRFWERFNLTLPGKISIYKTLLLPQVNFIATILTPNDFFLNSLASEMERFVLKGFNISKNRAYLSPDQGGLGMFNLKNFITALQVSWIRRACVNSNDSWKVDLRELGGGDVLKINSLPRENVYGVGLTNIISSFVQFRKKFVLYGKNFLNEKIFRSNVLGTGRGMTVPFDERFFGNDLMNESGGLIENLTMSNFIVNGEFTHFREVAFLTGINLSNNMYKAIKNCYTKFYKLSKNDLFEPQTLHEFFRKIKKGSKYYRLILDYDISAEKCILKNTQFKSFCKTTGTENVCAKRVKGNISSWNGFFMSNRLRVFLFKFYNNLLGVGSRLVHFNRNADVQCFFCVRNNNLPAPIESFSHIFFDCPFVMKIITRFSDTYFNFEVTRNNFFHGTISENERENKAISVLLDVLRYSIWQFRLNKQNLSFFTVEQEVVDIIEQITLTSNKINQLINNCTFISVDGRAEQGREGGQEQGGGGRGGPAQDGGGRGGDEPANSP